MPNSNTPATTDTKAIRTVSGALDVLNAKLGGAAGDIPADATKVDALKKVYATLGGTPTDVADISTTSEMIEKLAEVAEGGGGGGDSDFSAAIITIENTNNAGYDSLDHVEINYPCVYNDDYVGVANIPIDTDPVAIKIALYKGAAICYNYNFINNIAVFSPAPGSPSAPDVSGNIEYIYDDEESAWIYTIKGNCTIRVGSQK